MAGWQDPLECGRTVMKFPPLFRSSLACFAAIFLPLGSVGAIDVVTASQGIYTVKVPGATEDNPVVRTYLGIQLLPNTRFAGRVVEVGGHTLKLESMSDHQQLVTPGRKSHVHVLSGAGTGFVTDVD